MISKYAYLISKSAPFGEEISIDDAYHNPAVLLSVNDDLELLYKKSFFQFKQYDQKNTYRQMHLFQRLAKSVPTDFLCKLTYDDSRSLETYGGQQWGRLLKLRDMWPQLGTSFSTKVFNEASLIYPSLNIPTPFFPEIPCPSTIHANNEVTKKRLSENVLEEYSFIESSCDRFTLHL